MKLGLFDLSFNGSEGTGFTAGTDPIFNAKSIFHSLKNGVQAGFTLDPSRWRDKMFASNYHLTRAHPGTLATRKMLQDEMGVDIQGNTRDIAKGAGTVFGGIGGPIAGLIGGGAAGWGLSSQFGDEDDSKMGFDSAAQGAGTGLAAGFLSNYFKGDGGEEMATGTDTGGSWWSKMGDWFTQPRGNSDQGAIWLDKLGTNIAPNNPFAGIGTQMGQSSITNEAVQQQQNERQQIIDALRQVLYGGGPGSKSQATPDAASAAPRLDTIPELTPNGEPGPTSYTVTSDGYTIKGNHPGGAKAAGAGSAGSPPPSSVQPSRPRRDLGAYFGQANPW